MSDRVKKFGIIELHIIENSYLKIHLPTKEEKGKCMQPISKN